MSNKTVTPEEQELENWFDEMNVTTTVQETPEFSINSNSNVEISSIAPVVSDYEMVDNELVLTEAAQKEAAAVEEQQKRDADRKLAEQTRRQDERIQEQASQTVSDPAQPSPMNEQEVAAKRAEITEILNRNLNDPNLNPPAQTTVSDPAQPSPINEQEVAAKRAEITEILNRNLNDPNLNKPTAPSFDATQLVGNADNIDTDMYTEMQANDELAVARSGIMAGTAIEKVEQMREGKGGQELTPERQQEAVARGMKTFDKNHDNRIDQDEAQHAMDVAAYLEEGSGITEQMQETAKEMGFEPLKDTRKEDAEKFAELLGSDAPLVQSLGAAINDFNKNNGVEPGLRESDYANKSPSTAGGLGNERGGEIGMT